MGFPFFFAPPDLPLLNTREPAPVVSPLAITVKKEEPSLALSDKRLVELAWQRALVTIETDVTGTVLKPIEQRSKQSKPSARQVLKGRTYQLKQ